MAYQFSDDKPADSLPSLHKYQIEIWKSFGHQGFQLPIAQLMSDTVNYAMSKYFFERLLTDKCATKYRLNLITNSPNHSHKVWELLGESVTHHKIIVAPKYVETVLDLALHGIGPSLDWRVICTQRPLDVYSVSAYKRYATIHAINASLIEKFTESYAPTFDFYGVGPVTDNP